MIGKGSRLFLALCAGAALPWQRLLASTGTLKWSVADNHNLDSVSSNKRGQRNDRDKVTLTQPSLFSRQSSCFKFRNRDTFSFFFFAGHSQGFSFCKLGGAIYN